MGRGRAKAKQQKVARRLKYSGAGTDLDRLAEELGVAGDEPEDDPGAVDDGDHYAPHPRGDDPGDEDSSRRR